MSMAHAYYFHEGYHEFLVCACSISQALGNVHMEAQMKLECIIISDVSRDDKACPYSCLCYSDERCGTTKSMAIASAHDSVSS